MLTIDDWMVAWTPNGGIEVGSWPDISGWSGKYELTSGMCWLDRHVMSFEHKIAMMFIDFHTCVVRDAIDPLKAHQAFSKISEYRELISPDIVGDGDENET